MPRWSRWEPLACLLCAALAFVPAARVPAAFALLCLLPGVAICRHRLGERSPVRVLILGSLFSLCVVPAVTIPAALVTGRPIAWVVVLLAAAVTWAVCLRPVAPRPPEPLPRGARAHLAVVVCLALAMQIALSLAQYPAAGTIRWRGLPDLMFFNGIYTQLTVHMPPLDPENGAALLVHNWIYHSHFAMLHMVSGLDVTAMQRVVSAWMALVLLGLVYLVCADLLKRPTAGLLACLLLMISGEAYWLVRSLAHMAFEPGPMSWPHSPFGITMLFGWYNLPPISAALGAWYWFERHRARGRAGDLAASIALCVALAFFHPIYFGVFMIGFCLWLAWLWLREGPAPVRLAYLLTPMPFLLLYKLPYYGGSMPPSVVQPTLSAALLMTHARDFALSGGLYLLLGALGLAVEAGLAGPIGWIAGASLFLRIFVRSPNPHWFNDLLYVMLAIASGLGIGWLLRVAPRAGAAAVTLVFAVGGAAFLMHLRDVTSVGYTFTPGEVEAGDWLRTHTEADDLVAALPNSKSSFMILGLGGRRLVHGWTGHLLDFHDYALTQEREVRELFTTPDESRAVDLARKYRVRWVYLGLTEKAASGDSGPVGECFPTVFSGEGAEVRAFTCEQAAPASLPAQRPTDHPRRRRAPRRVATAPAMTRRFW